MTLGKVVSEYGGFGYHPEIYHQDHPGTYQMLLKQYINHDYTEDEYCQHRDAFIQFLWRDESGGFILKYWDREFIRSMMYYRLSVLYPGIFGIG